MELFFEFPGEGGVVGEAASEAELCNGEAGGGEEGFGQQQAFAINVLVDAVAGVCLEFAHKVVFAEVDLFSQGVNRKVISQMIADVFYELLDFWVIGGCSKLLQLISHQGSVQENHKFYEKDFHI